MTFINLSNHPSEYWSKRQREAAIQFGEIKDYSFPIVNPCATAEDISHLADQIAEDVLRENPEAVMCQGEFTLTFAIVHRLKERGIKVLSACTERHVNETIDEMGRKTRTSVFEFIQFREYLL